jgi:hypothetical protein
MRIEFLMNLKGVKISLSLFAVLTLLFLGACSRAHGDPAAEAPPPANIVAGADACLLTYYPEVSSFSRCHAVISPAETIINRDLKALRLRDAHLL